MATQYSGLWLTPDEEGIYNLFRGRPRTVDSLVNVISSNAITMKWIRDSNSTIYDIIIDNYPTLLLMTLESDSNEPSKHDLMLIRSISKLTGTLNVNAANYDYTHIMQIYKNRK